MQKIEIYRLVDGKDVVIAHASIDDEDVALVKSYGKWRMHNYGYAVCKKWIDGSRRTVLMHRLVLGVTDRQLHVDHVDHDKLNNQKYNLKVGTQADNNRNPTPHPRADSSSKYKGCGRYRGRWRAQGWKDGKTVWIGAFDTETEAKEAYDKWKENR